MQMKIDEFENAFPKLPHISKSGVIIYVRETTPESLRVAIDVGEFVTSDQLRDAIPLALEWRDKLIEFQGIIGIGSDYPILRDINNDLSHDYKFRTIWTAKGGTKTGMTYRDVATAINQIISEWLYESVDKSTPVNETFRYKKILKRHIFGIEERIPDPIERAQKFLKAMRLKDEEIELAISSGLESIKTGNYPFPDDYPLSKKKLISVLKWWRNLQQ
jgi:hypothetical protein